jgi:hypothetical protein
MGIGPRAGILGAAPLRNRSLTDSWLSSSKAAPFQVPGMLHDRTELIEPWVGLGLIVAVFVLALWLVPV